MNFFAEQRTIGTWARFLVPASWFQSMNPGVLILAARCSRRAWTALGRRGREPSAPAKMAAALVLLGHGLRVHGRRRAPATTGDPSCWSALVADAAYTFHTFGELCLSPIGLSLVTKLAPLKFSALVMGLWFLSTSISELVAGQLAALTDRVERGELFQLFGGQADFFPVRGHVAGGGRRC